MDLVPLLREIAEQRGEVTANRAHSALSAMFVHAISHGSLKRDQPPTGLLPRWQERSRQRVLSLAELGQIWQAAPKIDRSYGDVIRLLILTGCRRSEIADLRWSEVDLAEALISLPGSRVKNAKPFMIPLPPVAVEILRVVSRVGDRVWPSFALADRKAQLDKLVNLAPWTTTTSGAARVPFGPRSCGSNMILLSFC